METEDCLTICTFNCRSIKSSLNEIYSLCSNCDIVLLEEHWLLPNEISFLSNLHPDFMAIGHSAVNLSNNILVGRPYGGTGILYRKSLSNMISFVKTSNPRITSVILKSKLGPILIVCVYMPTDYGTSDCYEDYLELCSCISALYKDSDAVQLLVAGDFNCQLGSRFYPLLLNFINDNNLIPSDMCRLQDVFTFSNIESNHFSWIDHVLCSPAIDKLVYDCVVKYEYISSDHKPLIIKFKNLIVSMQELNKVNNESQVSKKVADWVNADTIELLNYQAELDSALSHIDIPVDLLLNEMSHPCCLDVENCISKYYSNVVSCINDATSKCIPCKTISCDDNVQ